MIDPGLPGHFRRAILALCLLLLGQVSPALAGSDRLIIDPFIRADWPGYKATYRKGRATYHISVENPERVVGGVKQIRVDGVALKNPADGVLLKDDGEHHEVEVILGG